MKAESLYYPMQVGLYPPIGGYMFNSVIIICLIVFAYVFLFSGEKAER